MGNFKNQRALYRLYTSETNLILLGAKLFSTLEQLPGSVIFFLNIFMGEVDDVE